MVHGGNLCDPISLNKRASYYLDEYKQSQASLVAIPALQSSREVWQSPPQSTFKLNFDASAFSKLNRSGFRAIVHNDKGEVMSTMTANGLKVSNSDEVEMLAY